MSPSLTSLTSPTTPTRADWSWQPRRAEDEGTEERARPRRGVEPASAERIGRRKLVRVREDDERQVAARHLDDERRDGRPEAVVPHDALPLVSRREPAEPVRQRITRCRYGRRECELSRRPADHIASVQRHRECSEVEDGPCQASRSAEKRGICGGVVGYVGVGVYACKIRLDGRSIES